MRIILVLAALLLANVALAQSNPSTDDINRLLAERGLVARIGDVGGKVEAKASELVINAMTFLGVPYKRGGTSSDTGFDCSGFVRAMYEQTAGLILPRKASEQAASAQKSTVPTCNPVIWCFSTRCAAHSATWVFMWVTANSSTLPGPAPKSGSIACLWPTGPVALTVLAGCLSIPRLLTSPDARPACNFAQLYAR